MRVPAELPAKRTLTSVSTAIFITVICVSRLPLGPAVDCIAIA
jgi:hypothetical protein